MKNFSVSLKKPLVMLGAGVMLLGLVGCNAIPAVAAAKYTPQTRNISMAAVSLAVHEMQDSQDSLKEAFAKGGVLDGKEIFGWAPPSITVYQGDKVNMTLVNPTGDDHTFAISGLGVGVNMKQQSTVKVSFVASKVGIFSYVCTVDEHEPYMTGTLVVLPDSDAAPAY